MNTSDTCQVCRRPRAMCICASHVEVQPMREADSLPEDLVRGFAGGPLQASQIEGRVQQAMHLYYERDAAALARLIRSWFE